MEHHPNGLQASVLIVTHNGEAYMTNLLESLRNQTVPAESFEIIIFDNNSSDATVHIAKHSGLPNLRVVMNAENIGYARGNNKALNHAQGEYVVLLNQDTICDSSWLENLLSAILDFDNAGAVSSNIVQMPESTADSQLSETHTVDFCDVGLCGFGRYYSRQLAKGYRTRIVSGCSCIIPRRIIDELGYLFDEGLVMYNEDTDLSLRIRNLGYFLWVSGQSKVFHLHAKPAISPRKFLLFARAIRNRVIVFFKNATLAELCVLLPVIFICGPLKIFHSPLSASRRAALFIPFALFSLMSMLLAVPLLPVYMEKRRRIMHSRRLDRLGILKGQLRQPLAVGGS